MDAVNSTPPAPSQAKALGARADNPWGWSAPLEDGEGGGEAGGAGRPEVAGGTAETPPHSRENSWTVPSPYQHLDEKFPSTGCLPDFHLDGGVRGAGGGSNDDGALGQGVVGEEEGGASWRSCSCHGDGEHPGGMGAEEELLRSWKACVSCGGVPMAVGDVDNSSAVAPQAGAMPTDPAAAEAAAAAAEPRSAADDIGAVVAEEVLFANEPQAAAASVSDIVAPAAAAATALGTAPFTSPLQDRLDGRGHLEYDVSRRDVIGRPSSEQLRPPMDSNREGFPTPAGGTEKLVGSMDDKGDHSSWKSVAGERGENPPLPTMQEVLPLVGGVGSLQDDRAVRGAFEGSERRRAEGEGDGGMAAAAVPSALGSAAGFDLGFGGGDTVDEWDDDLDPGYMVMAVSAQEFNHGQVKRRRPTEWEGVFRSMDRRRHKNRV